MEMFDFDHYILVLRIRFINYNK